jgi:RNA polymerase sigma-70 factor (ECF subfamily)
MYRIALNTAMLGLRAPRQKYSRLSDHDLDIRAEAEVYPEEDQKIRLLYTHISKLKDLDKTIVFLYLEECSYEEIAGITGISVKNVSVRLVRIREKLRKLFNVQNSAT